MGRSTPMSVQGSRFDSPVPQPEPGQSQTPQAYHSPFAWARRRTAAERPMRRLSGAAQRAEHKLAQLSPTWRVVEWPEPVAEGTAQSGFLAIGPGGVYSVTVVDHGRHRVMLAGDVVQIHGKRPPHVARARKDAKTASTVLTAAVGTTVPVVAVLTLVGSGAISAQGQPNGCLVVSYRELDRLLLAAGNKISTDTAQKLAEVASHPATWADQYRWYPANQTASDKGTARR